MPPSLFASRPTESRESAEITASLVVKQFEETERVLRRFQVANAQSKAVLDSVRDDAEAWAVCSWD